MGLFDTLHFDIELPVLGKNFTSGFQTKDIDLDPGSNYKEGMDAYHIDKQGKLINSVNGAPVDFSGRAEFYPESAQESGKADIPLRFAATFSHGVLQTIEIIKGPKALIGKKMDYSHLSQGRARHG